jgi:hypothetical protein
VQQPNNSEKTKIKKKVRTFGDLYFTKFSKKCDSDFSLQVSPDLKIYKNNYKMSGKTQDKVGNEVMFDLNQNSANPNSVPQTQKEGGQNFDMTAPTLEAKIPFIQKSESQITESPNSDMQINFDIENQNAKSEEMEVPTPYTDTTPKRSRSDNEGISTIKLDLTPKPPQLDTRPKSPKLDPLTSNEIEKQNADFENMKIQNESTEQSPMESLENVNNCQETDPKKLEKLQQPQLESHNPRDSQSCELSQEEPLAPEIDKIVDYHKDINTFWKKLTYFVESQEREGYTFKNIEKLELILNYRQNKLGITTEAFWDLINSCIKNLSAMKKILPPDRSATLWQQISDAIAQQKFNPNNKTKNQFYENLEIFWETASEPPKSLASVNTAGSNFEQIKKLLILKRTQHPISDGSIGI